MVYVGQVVSLVHALFSMITTFFGFFYADGERDTTWFHCNFYKMHMFDSQKYIITAHAGYYFFDLLLLLHNRKIDPNYQDMTIHRVLAIVQCGLAIRVQGFLGSLTQLTFLTETATPFVVFRSLLAVHDL